MDSDSFFFLVPIFCQEPEESSTADFSITAEVEGSAVTVVLSQEFPSLSKVVVAPGEVNFSTVGGTTSRERIVPPTLDSTSEEASLPSFNGAASKEASAPSSNGAASEEAGASPEADAASVEADAPSKAGAVSMKILDWLSLVITVSNSGKEEYDVSQDAEENESLLFAFSFVGLILDGGSLSKDSLLKVLFDFMITLLLKLLLFETRVLLNNALFVTIFAKDSPGRMDLFRTFCLASAKVTRSVTLIACISFSNRKTSHLLDEEGCSLPQRTHFGVK